MRIAMPAASLLLALAPPASLVTTASCVCSSIGFESGLVVQVEVPPDEVRYRVEVDADGDLLSLEYQVHANTTDGECLDGCQSTGATFIALHGFGSPSDLVPPVLRAVVTRRDDANAGPKRATVRVFRAGALLGEQAFEPDYESDHPNGRGCGKRVRGTVRMSVR
jgi:hypothetical protein